jgi:hypothetical protein
MYHIKVYFEVIGSHSELVAFFNCEETYNACLPALEVMAKERGMEVTESVTEEGSLDDVNRLCKDEASRREDEVYRSRMQAEREERKSSLGLKY